MEENAYEQMIREKTEKKKNVMNDKELELSEQYLLWYRRAYEDKQRLNLMQK